MDGIGEHSLKDRLKEIGKRKDNNYTRITEYLRLKFAAFHSLYETKINHLLGTLIQVDNMANIIIRKNKAPFEDEI